MAEAFVRGCEQTDNAAVNNLTSNTVYQRHSARAKALKNHQDTTPELSC